jgi:hypothetical protein
MGFSMGFSMGLSLGFTMGLSMGLSMGFSLGFSMGFSSSSSPFFSLGWSLGFSLGLGSGSSLFFLIPIFCSCQTIPTHFCKSAFRFSRSDFPQIFLDEKFEREGVFFQVDDDNGTKTVFTNGTIFFP